MKVSEVREKYIKFFESAPRNHKEIDPAPLVLPDDPTTLFTSSGMQPLVPYLMGEPHPRGKRLVDSQPSIRTIDIDEVGDNRHLTFFEMLGNWSLGDYFKDEQLNWFYEFLTKELQLNKDRLWVTVFEGNKQVPKDKESVEIWKKIGIPESRIGYYDANKNWWSRTGTPEQMPVGEIGGPDSEVFYDFGEDLKLHEKSEFNNEKCHPNCDCGRFMEVGNSVFIQYKKVGENKLEELPQKNVDFGGGLERIVAAVQGDPDIYNTDLFRPLLDILESGSIKKYKDNKREFRIITDHLKASVFLHVNGIKPSNKQHGYVMRRLIRRFAYKMNKLGIVTLKELPKLTGQVINIYKDLYLEGVDNYKVHSEIGSEIDKFFSTLAKGEKYLASQPKISAQVAFNSLATYGIPFEVSRELARNRGEDIDTEEYEKEFKKHQELSRSTSAGVFKGGLADHSSDVVRLHTATHLLLASLRKVLGDHVVQKGQNITSVRSRFDFPNSEKLAADEIKKVEDTINDIIEKDLPVNFIVMPKDEAEETGAIHAFNEKYADTVKVYYVGKNLESAFSKEFCGGPHVARTGSIGRVRIKKQERIGSGVVRIYLELIKPA
jgi:alanyl-tRNA synthetase